MARLWKGCWSSAFTRAPYEYSHCNSKDRWDWKQIPVFVDRMQGVLYVLHLLHVAHQTRDQARGEQTLLMHRGRLSTEIWEPGHVVSSRQLSLQESPRRSGQLAQRSPETVRSVISDKVLHPEKSPEDTEEQPWSGRGQRPSLRTWPLPCGNYGWHQGRAVKVQLSQ